MGADAAPPAGQRTDDELQREGQVLGRYLVGVTPNAQALGKYVDAVRRVPELAGGARGFEGILLQVATTHPVLTRAVDLYARFFRPGALVRKRLVLLFAVLESMGESTHHFDDSDASGPVGFVVRLVLVGLWLGLLLVLAMATLGPLQLLLPAGGQTLTGPQRGQP